MSKGKKVCTATHHTANGTDVWRFRHWRCRSRYDYVGIGRCALESAVEGTEHFMPVFCGSSGFFVSLSVAITVILSGRVFDIIAHIAEEKREKFFLLS